MEPSMGWGYDCCTLYDCPDQSLDKAGKLVRIIVATHPATEKRSRIGVTRSGVVYELFLANLPQSAFTATDVVALYLHRGLEKFFRQISID